MNGTTSNDLTLYFETLPANQLELALFLEADRMRNSFIADADRQSEMTAQAEELSATADELRSLVASFRLDASGGVSAAPSRSQAGGRPAARSSAGLRRAG